MKQIGLLHGLTNVVVVALFAFAWWTRSAAPAIAPGTSLFAIELVALLLGAVGGWPGGELVDRLGIGLNEGAHANAPSSLSGRPAWESSVETQYRRAG